MVNGWLLAGNKDKPLNNMLLQPHDNIRTTRNRPGRMLMKFIKGQSNPYNNFIRMETERTEKRNDESLK